MTLEQLANLAEIIGGVAVIASLVYLAVQIRQNTATVRAATLASNTDIWSSMLVEVAAADKIEAYLLGSIGKADMDPKQFLQFFLICRAMFVSFENQFYQFSNSTMDKEIYLGYERCFQTQVLAFSGFRRYWQQTREEFSPDFIARVDFLLTETPATDNKHLMQKWRELSQISETAGGE